MNERIKSPKPKRRSTISTPAPYPTSKRRPLRLRIVLVGAEKTGKSCLIKRYCEKRFVSKYMPTIGIDYGATKIYVDKKEVAVHIFDTSGNAIFGDVRNEFYSDAHGVLLTFDVSKRETFEALDGWLLEVRKEMARHHKGQDHPPPVVLVCANKIDLAERSVDEVEAKLWADIHGLTYCETSAYNGAGVGDMFHAFFSAIVKNQMEVATHTGSLPKTPASARRVHLSQNNHSPAVGSQPCRPEPSDEQLLAMQNLESGCDPWQQLGLEQGCPEEEVNKTYRKLAVLLHPDKTAVQGADDAFKLLGVARRNILNSLNV